MGTIWRFYVWAGEDGKSSSHDDPPNEIWSYKQFLECSSIAWWIAGEHGKALQIFIFYHMCVQEQTLIFLWCLILLEILLEILLYFDIELSVCGSTCRANMA